jgi:hypothetical protein
METGFKIVNLCRASRSQKVAIVRARAAVACGHVMAASKQIVVPLAAIAVLPPYFARASHMQHGRSRALGTAHEARSSVSGVGMTFE